MRTTSALRAMANPLGPRYFQLAQNWVVSAGIFGASAAVVGLYISEWKLVMGKVPFYGKRLFEDAPK